MRFSTTAATSVLERRISSAEMPSATRMMAGTSSPDAVPQQDDAAVRLQRLEDLVHEELQQLVHRDVAQQLDRQLVDDAQRLDELGELLGRQPRVRLGVLAQQLGRGLQDRVVERFLSAAVDANARRGLGLDLERHAADGDAVAGLQGWIVVEPVAVQEGAVARAEVLDGEAAVVSRTMRACWRDSILSAIGRSFIEERPMVVTGRSSETSGPAFPGR